MGNNFKIDLTCDEWYMADSLHELGARIENDDLLDDMQDGRVTVSGDHYTAEITKTNEEVSECNEDPLTEYSEDYRKGIAYMKEQLGEDDKAIIRAECSKAYKMHLVPNGDVVDDSKITDLLEEYGQDHDLLEGWYLEEYDSSEILAML